MIFCEDVKLILILRIILLAMLMLYYEINYVLFSPFYFNQKALKDISNCCNPPIKQVLSIGE